ncbi:MAG TPA: hypothetical protein VFU68_04085, partial [Terracidiphilus sp.]|nr:hypothetical protein [Terracidiphilus sp.]
MSGIWVVLEERSGHASPISLEAIAAGRQLAQQVSKAVCAVVLGSGVQAFAEEAKQHGVDSVLCIT